MNKAKSRTSLVLMELIITILFFSLASAVCVQLFVRAHLTSNETKKLNEAINITQSIAEVMNGTDGSLTSVQNHYPNAVGDDDYFVIYYDENFKETDDYENARYAADVTINATGNLYSLNVDFLQIKDYYDIVYSIDTSKYIRKTYNN